MLLSKIDSTEKKMSYKYDTYFISKLHFIRFLFHYLTKDHILYMCATDTDYEKRLPYAFLEDISVRFINSLGPLVDQAQGELSLNDKFLPILKKQIVYINLNNLYL